MNTGAAPYHKARSSLHVHAYSHTACNQAGRCSARRRRRSLKINALLQFRMMYHKMNLAKSASEQEALATTLQEYNDKLVDLGDMKRNMLQAGMERARAQALERKVGRTERAVRLAAAVNQSKVKLTASLSTPASSTAAAAAGEKTQAAKNQRLAKIARAMSAPAKKD